MEYEIVGITTDNAEHAESRKQEWSAVPRALR